MRARPPTRLGHSHLRWDYPGEGETREPDVEAVLKEINGYDVATGPALSAFTELKRDGTTASRMLDLLRRVRRRRQPGPPPRPRRPDGPRGSVSPEWAWAWPANRRILYNRASADPDGRPWSERKRHVWWTSAGALDGLRRARLPGGQAARLQARARRAGMDAIGGADPFIMLADGRGWLFAPAGLLDGPMPTHYEPIESPVDNLLYPDVGANPSGIRWQRPRTRTTRRSTRASRSWRRPSGSLSTTPPAP